MKVCRWRCPCPRSMGITGADSEEPGQGHSRKANVEVLVGGRGNRGAGMLSTHVLTGT